MSLNTINNLIQTFASTEEKEVPQWNFIDDVICSLQNKSQTKFNINHDTTFITSCINFLDHIFETYNLSSGLFIWYIAKILQETSDIKTKLELEVHTQIFQFVLSKIVTFENNEHNQQLLYWSIMNYVINDKQKLISNNNNTIFNTKQYKFSIFDMVSIHSLINKSEYNGLDGIILNFNPSKQRYHVHCEYKTKPINIFVKPSSLTPIENNRKYNHKLWITKNIKIFTDFMIKEKESNLCLFYDSQWKKRELLLQINSYVYKMSFYFQIFGDKPKTGRNLFLSFHGGGGCTKKTNNKQFANQQHLYDATMANLEGVYMAVRAPTNSWDMFHQKQIDLFINIIIKLSEIKLNVNVNKIYLLGYSAGGDGVYRIGTRLANRFAGISMMAGHPGNCTPYNLNNTAFSIHIGEMDHGYNRKHLALKWQKYFQELRRNEKGYYENCKVVIYKNKSHNMEREEAEGLIWMKQFERNPYPKMIKWRQENVENIEFYWLSVKKEFIKQNGQIQIYYEKENNCIYIVENYCKELNIHLNEYVLDMNRSIKIVYKGNNIFNQLVCPRLIDLWYSYQYSADSNRLFCVTLTVLDNRYVTACIR